MDWDLIAIQTHTLKEYGLVRPYAFIVRKCKVKANTYICTWQMRMRDANGEASNESSHLHMYLVKVHMRMLREKIANDIGSAQSSFALSQMDT
jgi:hypothetical protein